MAEYNAVTGRALLENAIAIGSKPTLSVGQVDILMDVAESDGVYTSASLTKAAALGWEWKSGIVADQYDIGGGNGKYLTRSQWFEMCSRMAADYRNGTKSVDGSAVGMGARGFGVIGIRGELTGDV